MKEGGGRRRYTKEGGEGGGKRRGWGKEEVSKEGGEGRRDMILVFFFHV